MGKVVGSNPVDYVFALIFFIFGLSNHFYFILTAAVDDDDFLIVDKWVSVSIFNSIRYCTIFGLSGEDPL